MSAHKYLAGIWAVLALLPAAAAQAAPGSPRVGVGVSIGPPSAKPAIVKQIFEHVGSQRRPLLFRFNMAQKNRAQAMKEAGTVLATARELGIKEEVPMLFDLPGGKIRLGPLPAEGPVVLHEGQSYTLRYGHGLRPSTTTAATVNYARLGEYAKVGDIVSIRRGKIQLKVTKVYRNKDKIETRVIRGDELRSESGVILVGKDPLFPLMTKVDRKQLKAAVASGATHIGMSMVQTADQVRAMRRALNRLGAPQVRIVAKIESLSALQNLSTLAKEADMLMVARGDLLATLGGDKRALHAAEKKIAAAAKAAGTPFFEASGYEGADAASEVARSTKLKPQPLYLVLKETAKDAKAVERVADFNKLLASKRSGSK